MFQDMKILIKDRDLVVKGREHLLLQEQCLIKKLLDS